MNEPLLNVDFGSRYNKNGQYQANTLNQYMIFKGSLIL